VVLWFLTSWAFLPFARRNWAAVEADEDAQGATAR
jgi:hypothetical protein